MSRRIALLLALTLPGFALADVVWKSDFETGDLSEWDKVQQMSADRNVVVPDETGNRVLHTKVIQGDDPINASGNRNEVVKVTNEEPGSEYFYSWSTLFPENFPNVDKWQLFTQWHQAGCCGSPPLEFFVTGDQMHLRVGGQGDPVWSAPYTRGEWQNFVLHVKWSDRPDEGFVELWLNGQQVMPKTMMATQFDKTGQYLKLGLYRDESISQVGEIFHDNFVMGTTLADVMPVTAPEPPAVAGAPEPPGGMGVTEGGQATADGVPGGTTPGAAGCSSVGASAMPLAALFAGAVLFLFAKRRTVALAKVRRSSRR